MYKNEIKLDKTTFPEDGRKVRYDTYEMYDLYGWFDADGDLIMETPNGGNFIHMWHVNSWEYVD